MDLTEERDFLLSLVLLKVFLMSIWWSKKSLKLGENSPCVQASKIPYFTGPHLVFSKWLKTLIEILLSCLVALSSSCALDEPVILSISLALDFWQVGCLWPKFSDVFKIIMFLSIIHTFLVPIMASTEDGSQKWGSFFLNHTTFGNCLLHFIFLFPIFL